MLHAFGRGFFSFFAFRGLLGLTESVNFPAALRAVAEWFPKHERSHATGIVTAGTGIGAIVAPPAVFVESPYVAVLLVSTALFAIQVKRSSLFAVPTDLFPAKDVASVWGTLGRRRQPGRSVRATADWLADRHAVVHAGVRHRVAHAHCIGTRGMREGVRDAGAVFVLAPSVESARQSRGSAP